MSDSRVIAMTEVGSAAAPAPTRAAAAAIPDGELVILQVKPHPLFIVLSILSPLVLCSVAAIALRWLSGRQVRLLRGPVFEAPDLGRLWLVPVAFAVALVLWQFLEWRARTYLLTDRRVVRVGGVLRQVALEIPLPRVQQVMHYRSIRERFFGLGTPGVSSASSGSTSYLFWQMIARPHERLRVLRETIAKYGGNGRSPKGGV